MRVKRSSWMSAVAVFALMASTAYIGACSSSSDSPKTGSVAETVVAADGGTVESDSGQLAGATVEIPAGALAADTEITINKGSAETVADKSPASIVLDLGPEGTTFTTPVTVTIPYNPALLPEGTLESEIEVYRASGDPVVVEQLTIVAQDEDANTVQVQTDHFSRFWAAAFRARASNEYEMAAYWPLTAGDSVDMKAETAAISDTVVEVTESSAEPNLEGTNLSLWYFDGDTTYLTRNENGQTYYHGFIYQGEVDSEQGVPADPLMILPANMAVGDSNTVTITENLYTPVGSTTPSETVTEEITITLMSHGSVMTAMGEFDDVLRLHFESSEELPGGGTETETWDWWFARGVGLVKADDAGNVWSAISGTVGGNEIAADTPLTITTAAYFPLNDGDTWTFDDETVTVEVVTNEPRLVGTSIYLFSYGDSDFDYITRGSGGETLWHGGGSNNGVDDEQLLLDTSVAAFPATLQIHQPYTFSDAAISLYAPISETTPTSTGTISRTVTFRGFETVTTTLGTFHNAARIDETFTEDFGTPETETYTVWYVEGVGRVMESEPGFGTTTLVSGTVGGVAVAADE